MSVKDLGEPWGRDHDREHGDLLIRDRHGNEIARVHEEAVWLRMQQESEALAGCPDPVAFVKAVMKLHEHADILGILDPNLKRSAVHQASKDPALAWLHKT